MRKARLKAERAARGGLGRDWDYPREAIRVRLAKWFAERHGSKGAVGGWIYSASGRPLCQGWSAYYRLRKRGIWREVWGR
jgi:hypothetical protein